jgi:hypothetical protein
MHPSELKASEAIQELASYHHMQLDTAAHSTKSMQTSSDLVIDPEILQHHSGFN